MTSCIPHHVSSAKETRALPQLPPCNARQRRHAGSSVALDAGRRNTVEGSNLLRPLPLTRRTERSTAKVPRAWKRTGDEHLRTSPVAFTLTSCVWAPVLRNVCCAVDLLTRACMYHGGLRRLAVIFRPTKDALLFLCSLVSSGEETSSLHFSSLLPVCPVSCIPDSTMTTFQTGTIFTPSYLEL